MYRLTKDIVSFLVSNARDPEFPTLKVDEKAPFTPKNLHSIGMLDPTCSMGADFDYIIESSVAVFAETDKHIGVDGYWLYRREELTKPTEPVSIPAIAFDPNAKEDDMLDVTDCCVVTPPMMDKLTATLIKTLKNLITIEPGLKLCLRPEALKEIDNE